MREAFIEYEDGIKEHMVNNRHTSEDPCRRMDKYLKGKNWFQLSSKPTGARLEGKQSTLPVVELKQKDTSSLDKPSLSQHPQSRLCNHSNLQLKVFRGTSDTCAVEFGGDKDDEKLYSIRKKAGSTTSTFGSNRWSSLCS